MTFKIGLIGKPNAGKSTLFSAITATEVEIANYPFTTIKANEGTSFIIRECPEKLIAKKCQPNHGSCSDGMRYIPVQIVDVPGLIEGASEGKGMGNQFLQSIMDADALILVIDLHEAFSSENAAEAVDTEIRDIRGELLKWLSSLLSRDWERFAKKADISGERVERQILRKAGSLGLGEKEIHEIMQAGSLPQKLSAWGDSDFNSFADLLFSRVKPLSIVGNKADLLSHEQVEQIKRERPEVRIISAEYELALQKALSHGLIMSRMPPFKQTDRISEKQSLVLAKIEAFISSGIAERPFDILNDIVENILQMIVVYPVYDEAQWTDKSGNILPDAFFMHQGDTPLDLAFKVHTQIGEGFIRAIDCKTKMVIGKDHVLKDSDVIRIIAKA